MDHLTKRARPRVVCFIFLALLLIFLGCNPNDIHQPSGKSATSVDIDALKGAFIAALGSTDQAVAEKSFHSIYRVITARQQAEELRRAKAKEISSDLMAEMRKATGGRISEETAVTLADAFQGDGTSSAQVMDARVTVKDTLNEIAAQLQLANSTLSDYEAKKLTYKALRAAWPEQSTPFAPAPELSAIEDLEPPAISEEYAPLMELTGEFWEHDLYKKLEQLPKDAMPDGALIPIIYLGGISVPAAILRDGWITEPDSLLSRYGVNACQAIAYCLAKTGECKRDFAKPPYHYFNYLRECPSEFKEKVMAAALRSGWNNVGRYLVKDEPWADALLEEFEDSPYGKPYRREKS